MKKILIALLTIAMASTVMFTGCSSEDNNSSDSSSISQESSKSNEEASNSDTGEATDGDFVWQDGKYITDLSDEGAKKSEIVIPEKCQMFMMSDFMSRNFSNNDNLESIIFESESITDLPAACFIYDENLKNVELPKNLKRISENIFDGCKSLESIEIPSSVTEIEEQAFQDTAIKELKIPESVTTVGDAVFRYTKIEKLYLPESLTEINSQFLSWLDNSDPDYKLTVYVKKGSYADEHFDDFKMSCTIKEYY